MAIPVPIPYDPQLIAEMVALSAGAAVLLYAAFGVIRSWVG